jgi:hypothetical protein
VDGETHAYFDASLAVVSNMPYRARTSDKNVVEVDLKYNYEMCLCEIQPCGASKIHVPR